MSILLFVFFFVYFLLHILSYETKLTTTDIYSISWGCPQFDSLILFENDT